ncbi:MAG: guanylate kinase [Planctomycetes bacterium]|nr:guanylate kinase [Planctomycetota bacterium]
MAKNPPHPGMLLIISGPSGVGKTTITHEVEKALNGVFSVSMTTRPRAAGDREGVDYHFVDQSEFDRARNADELLEWAEVYPGCSYGTPRRPVEEALREGKLMILEIDVAGAEQVKRKMHDIFAVFVLPPSEEVLLERLRKRKREEEAVIQRRFSKALSEIVRAMECGVYNEFIVNDDLGKAVEKVVQLVTRELHLRAARR